MTALRSPSQIVRGLFLDSLLFMNLLPPRPIRLLDIGAGSGIPGLPLRLADDRISLTLIESKRKRVSFLLAACRELDLPDVRIGEGRAEELVERESDLADSFDAVVARAVGDESFLVAVGSRYVRSGGIIAIAGSPRVAAAPPFEVIRVQSPGTRGTRVFLRAPKQGTVPRGT